MGLMCQDSILRITGAQGRVSQRENCVFENPRWRCVDWMGREKPEAADQGRR